MLEECNPDVIVTDINMPRLDGFGFIEGVRGTKSTALSRSWFDHGKRCRKENRARQPARQAGS